jgi:hypothetical protein
MSYKGGVDATPRKYREASIERSGRGGRSEVIFTKCMRKRCGRPPRLRGQTKLRVIFLDRAATPPLQGREYATLSNKPT